MPKSELNSHKRLDKMQFIMKSKQNNNVDYHTGVISAKYDTKLSRPIKQCTVYDKDETGQRCD